MSSLKARRAVLPPKKPKPVAIMFACNDPDNGMPAHTVCQINLMLGGEIALDLTARNWRLTTQRGCPAFREQAGAIRVAGKRWEILRAREWVGNWCWNEYLFADQVARLFLVWLHGTGKFDCEGGFSELFNAWRQPAPLPLFPERSIGRGLWESVTGGLNA